jgi:hypothetical protein
MWLCAKSADCEMSIFILRRVATACHHRTGDLGRMPEESTFPSNTTRHGSKSSFAGVLEAEACTEEETIVSHN